MQEYKVVVDNYGNIYWYKYNNKEISFNYENIIYNDNIYWNGVI